MMNNFFLQTFMNERDVIVHKVFVNESGIDPEDGTPISLRLVWTYNSREEIREFFPELYFITRNDEMSS